MISPYTKYAEAMTRAADEAESLADDMRAAKMRAPDAEGATADAIAAGFDNDVADLMAIAEAAREAARVASEQAPADARFAAAPSPDDVKAAQDAVTRAEESGADRQDIAKARNHAAALATEREDAKDEHARVSRRTTAAFQAIKIAEVPMISVPTPTVVRSGDTRIGGRTGTPGTDGQGQDASTSNNGHGGGGGMPSDASSSSGGSPLSDSDAGTALSADGSGVPMTAQQLAGQPQPMGQQPGAMSGQPQMSPMSQMGAVPSTGVGNLSAGTTSRGKRKDDKRNDNGSPVAPVMSPMSFGGANAGGGTIDRGSSTSGVTTNANTSGNLKTALSGAVVPPGTGSQPGMMARGGGMMGGAPGAGGAGGGGVSKERPTIYDAHRPDEVERRDSIQDGTLSRATAEDPNIVDERERGK